MQLRIPTGEHARVSIELWHCLAASARAKPPANGFPDDRVAPNPKGSAHGRGH